MKKIKISAVSYLNTKPLLWGLEQDKELLKKIDLSLEIPSQTAARLLNGQVDLGLVPVGILPQLGRYEIVSDYCIGTEGEVGTVCLFSQKPLSQIKKIWLDYHSCTSVRLIQILCKHFWQISPEFLPAKQGYIEQIEGDTAGLIIGDRVFTHQHRFTYCYDLGLAWKQKTGLPFVFAAWVSRTSLPEDFLNAFNSALGLGIEHIEKVIVRYHSQYPEFDLNTYFKQHISYHFDFAKQTALKRFLDYIQ